MKHVSKTSHWFIELPQHPTSCMQVLIEPVNQHYPRLMQHGLLTPDASRLIRFLT